MAAEGIKQIGSYTVFKKERIGRGGFGTVYRAKNEDGQHVAAKKIIIENSLKSPFQELTSYLLLPDHDNIVKLYDVEVLQPRNDLYVFMELCPHGDLNEYFKKYFDNLATTESKLPIMRQVANGLSFLHDQSITHRDIKPRNILITGSPDPDQCQAKISDFGLAKFLNPEDTSAMFSDVGTLAYKAPEFHMTGSRNDICYHKNVDVYATGLTFLAMFTARKGEKLSPTLSPTLSGCRYIGLQMHMRKERKLAPLDVAPYKTSDNMTTRMVKGLLKKMTEVEAKNRLNAAEVAKILKTQIGSNVAESFVCMFHTHSRITLLQDDRVAICGKITKQSLPAVHIYNAEGTVKSCVQTPECSKQDEHGHCMLETNLGRCKYFAISCPLKREVWFVNFETNSVRSVYRDKIGRGPMLGYMSSGPNNTIFACDGRTLSRHVAEFIQVNDETLTLSKMIKVQGVCSPPNTVCYTETRKGPLLITGHCGEHVICATNLENGRSQWQVKGEVAGEVCRPLGICNGKGRLYVADGDNKRVLVMDGATGGYIQSIDQPIGGSIWDVAWSQRQPHLVLQQVTREGDANKHHIRYLNI